jgi:hypothetical protein
MCMYKSRRQAAVARSDSSLADSDHGVWFFLVYIYKSLRVGRIGIKSVFATKSYRSSHKVVCEVISTFVENYNPVMMQYTLI